MKAKDIMTKRVKTVSENTLVKRAAEIIAKSSISCIVVTKAKKPVGVLTERDIIRDVFVPNLNRNKTLVKEVMNRDLPCVSSNIDIFDLIEFMKEKFLRRVPVVNSAGNLIGIITETDIVNAVIRLGKEFSEKMKKGSGLKKYLEKQKKLYKDLQEFKNIRNMVNTGSEELNVLMGGGFPRGSTILIQGEPGSGKTLLSYSFLYKGLLHGECGIHILSNESKEETRNGFKSLGYDIEEYEKNKKLFFYDVCSQMQKRDEVGICDGFKNLYSIKDYILGIRSKVKGRMRLVINIVSQAYMFWGPNVVYRFLFDLKHYLIENNITSLFLIDEGMLEEKDLISLEQLMDGVIVLKTREENKKIKKYLLIKKIQSGNIIQQKYHLLNFVKGKGVVLTGKGVSI